MVMNSHSNYVFHYHDNNELSLVEYQHVDMLKFTTNEMHFKQEISNNLPATVSRAQIINNFIFFSHPKSTQF